MDDKLEKVLSRLKRQYEAYENELNEVNEETDGMLDISVACSLANSVPYLIKQIEQLSREAEMLEKIRKISNAEDLTLADFARSTLIIIEGREMPIRKERS